MDRWYNITSKTDGSKKMEPKKSPIFISFRFQNPNRSGNLLFTRCIVVIIVFVDSRSEFPGIDIYRSIHCRSSGSHIPVIIKGKSYGIGTSVHCSRQLGHFIPTVSVDIIFPASTRITTVTCSHISFQYTSIS